MRKLVLVALLALPVSAQAQSIGCFVDFSTGVCDGGRGQSYTTQGSYIELQNKYGQVMAQAIFTYFDEWQNCSAKWSETIDVATNIESLYFREQKKVKRLRNKIRKLSRR